MENGKILDFDNGEFDFLSESSVGSSSPPVSSAPPAAGCGGSSYILHHVSKFDTLAGVAIKYGVEVADIKRLNGLVTDLQMFALKTIRIPLPGRHPPSPGLCNGHDTSQRPSSSAQTPSNRRHSDIFDTLQSLRLKSSEQKISPAMNNLRSYYGLKQQPVQKTANEGFEMAVYRNRAAHSPGDGQFSTSSSSSCNTPLSHQRKSRSVANCLMAANGDIHDPLLTQEAENSSSGKWLERLLRGHQKSETNFISRRPPEKLLKEENGTNSVVSAVTGKRLALRPKAASRTALAGVETESAVVNHIPIGLGDSLLPSNGDGVRKSSSASSLQDSDNSALSSIWPTSKWSLKPDFQALSSAGLPMFDGLPKPMSRRNKAALD